MVNAKRKNYISVLLPIVLFLLCTVFLPSFINAKAITSGTSVLDDLQKDELFNADSYPVKADDYSVNVIQIAESSEKTLVVYAYIPSRETTGFDAASISISTERDPDIANKVQGNDFVNYRLYNLELLSSQSVFVKYLVKDLTVSSDAMRYYSITSIYRKWDNEIDGVISGATGSEKAYPVGRVFSAATVNGNVTYKNMGTEVIEIRAEDRFDGSIRYSNGFHLYVDKCDAWFVAFSTDRKIDDLMEAEISWVWQEHIYQVAPGVGGTHEDRGDPQIERHTIKATDEAGNDASGLFAKKRVWKRIEKASEFRDKETLTEEAKNALKNKQWVLRFTETSYRVESYSGVTTEYSTRISKVTILRLMFETDGVVYNLGVVSDKISPDNNPDGELPLIPGIPSGGCGDFSWSNLWRMIIFAIIVIVIVVCIIAFFPHIISFLVWLAKFAGKLIFYLLKGIWIILSAPFKGIANLIRKARDKKQ